MNEKIAKLMRDVLRVSARVTVACQVLCAWLLFASTVHAQATALGSDGLGGGRHVGSARVKGAPLRAVGALGYAHTEAVLGGDDRHHRLFGELAAGYVARPWFQVALKLDARFDSHSGTTDADNGMATSTELVTRHAFLTDSPLSLAGQARLRFPAASSASRGLKAATPELSALASYALFGDGELSGTLGYRIDRSQAALDRADRQNGATRLATMASRYDAVLIGALLSGPLAGCTLIGEWSWDVQVGSGAPSAIDSPMRLRAALQRVVGTRFVPGAELGVHLGGRPELAAQARVEPRFWAALTLGITFLDDSSEPAPAVSAVVEPSAQPAPARRGEMWVQVTDPDATPIAGASVTMRVGEQEESKTTDAEGRVQFEADYGANLRFAVQAEGTHPAELAAVLSSPRQELSVSLKRALPEGEIKGRVRSLRGGPLKSRVEVVNTGLITETEDDGTFRIVVPPGDYVLRISADGHEPQERHAQVERLGVTILVVDLRRTGK